MSYISVRQRTDGFGLNCSGRHLGGKGEGCAAWEGHVTGGTARI